MVKKIPRDHKGLYLSVPFTHGKQTKISGVSSKERKELPVKGGNEQVRTAQRLGGRKMRTKNERRMDAMELFQYGYEDTVIAARTQFEVEVVKLLRERWEQLERWETGEQ